MRIRIKNAAGVFWCRMNKCCTLKITKVKLSVGKVTFQITMTQFGWFRKNAFNVEIPKEFRCYVNAQALVRTNRFYKVIIENISAGMVTVRYSERNVPALPLK